MAALALNMSTWNGVIPVLLPWGQPTIAPIGVASAGVAVPFVLYVIAMFVIIIPIWMRNFEEDKRAAGPPMLSTEPQQRSSMIFLAPGNNTNGYLLPSDGGGDYATEFRLRPQQQGMY